MNVTRRDLVARCCGHVMHTVPQIARRVKRLLARICGSTALRLPTMIYQPPDYDDELTPEMREQRDRFRQLFALVLTKFRGETRKALVIALIDAMTEATIAGELCEPACEELTIEIQLRYQDSIRSECTE